MGQRSDSLAELAHVASVLVIDDEPDMRLLARAVIRQSNTGWEVVAEAADGTQGLAKWREVQPDAVVLDFRMPGMDGLTLARRILAEKPDQKIVLCSAFLDTTVREEARKLGLMCLSKDELGRLGVVLSSL